MTAIGIFFGILPGFAWLFFFLQEDPRPEPKRLLAITFASGIAFGFYALVAENIANSFLGTLRVAVLSPVSIAVLALIEEAAKFGAAYYAIHKDAEFDEPVDAMIYMIVAAMGFATLENLGALNLGTGSQTAAASAIFELASLRFVGATLLHSLASGIMGYFWALSIRNFGNKWFLIKGLVYATGLHAVFNFLILNASAMAYPILLVLIVGFFIIGDFEKLKRARV
ncbi:MAG: PrsW family intramembrane metalloprotease [Candidatus Liptonbacteria bacterium]|nr:PrsW family intramembrane metalloprotease [Candidatus Liptonbacteria bacterium]